MSLVFVVSYESLIEHYTIIVPWFVRKNVESRTGIYPDFCQEWRRDSSPFPINRELVERLTNISCFYLFSILIDVIEQLLNIPGNEIGGYPFSFAELTQLFSA